MGEERKKKFGQARDAGVYMSIPMMFLAGPVIGYLIGSWLQKHWIQEPWGMLLGLIVGFGGAVKAMIDVLKQQEEKNSPPDRDKN